MGFVRALHAAAGDIRVRPSRKRQSRSTGAHYMGGVQNLKRPWRNKHGVYAMSGKAYRRMRKAERRQERERGNV